MAEIRNEKEKAGKGCDDSVCNCAGHPEAGRAVNNSIRGAALSLCMSVDELLELLEKRDARLSWSSTDPAKLARIAELESENKRLKHELEQHLLQLKALQELIVIKF